MKAKCSKCKTIDDVVEQVVEFGESYKFCKICTIVLDKANETGMIKDHFLKIDFGKFPATQVEKNIINARIDRADNKSKWRQTVDK